MATSTKTYEQLLHENDDLRRKLHETEELLGEGSGPRAVEDDNKRRESELRHRMEELAQADRRKNDFLAVLGHELRNPLGPIRNATEVLKLLELSHPTARQALDIIDRQARHMTRLIDDLLDVSRIARGKILVRKERLNLSALVMAAVKDHQPTLEANGLKLEVDLPAESPWLMGDATRLAQIISNVLQNAGKFTNAGGRVTIRLTADVESRQTVLAIRDTGIGMTPETLARVFETYSQADRSTSRSRGGLGLGLALVKGLIELHGGTVSAFSEGPGRGSEITIRLPMEC